MGYVELGKLYYGDKGNYNAVYQSRLQSSDCISLDFTIGKHPAFFIQCSEASGLMFQILRTDKSISLLKTQLPGIAIEQFTKRCLIDEIILTNQIEGVHSTRREISDVLNDLEKKVESKHGKKRFYGLTAQYRKLQCEADIPLKSCRDIRALYDELVLRDVLNEETDNRPDGVFFRKDSASVVSSTGKEIHRGIFPENAIIEAVERSLALLNDENIELLYRISIFHYLLEYIHPFYDGNGRLGRFIFSSLLRKELDSLLCYRMSYTILQNISSYYEAFKICNNPRNLGDVTPFVLMMLTMVQKASSQLETALEKRNALLNKYRKAIPSLPDAMTDRMHDLYHILIQASLFAEHGISTGELTTNMKCSYTTLKKSLDAVSKNGLLIKVKVGKENCYSLDLDRLDNQLLLNKPLS